MYILRHNNNIFSGGDNAVDKLSPWLFWCCNTRRYDNAIHKTVCGGVSLSSLSRMNGVNTCHGHVVEKNCSLLELHASVHLSIHTTALTTQWSYGDYQLVLPPVLIKFSATSAETHTRNC